jgi:hypothetical protein
MAFHYARETVEAVFAHYGLRADDLFDACEAAMETAVSEAT